LPVRLRTERVGAGFVRDEGVRRLGQGASKEEQVGLAIFTAKLSAERLQEGQDHFSTVNQGSIRSRLCASGCMRENMYPARMKQPPTTQDFFPYRAPAGFAVHYVSKSVRTKSTHP